MRVLLTALIFTLLIPSVKSQQLIIDNQGHAGLVNDIVFIDQGKKILSVSDDKTVRVWDVASGTLAKTYRFETELGANGRIYAAALSKNQKYLFLGGYFDHEDGDKNNIGEIRVLDLVNEKLLPALKGHTNVVLDLVISSDGTTMVSTSADQSIMIWNISSPRSASVDNAISSLPATITSLAINNDGSILAAGDVDGNIQTWGIDGSSRSKTRIHTSAVRDLVFVGESLLSGGEDGQIVEWTQEGRFKSVYDQLPGAINVLEISPDQRYLTAMGRVGVVYDFNSKARVSKFDLHTNSVSAIASAPFNSLEQQPGYYVASAGGNDKNILLWELKSGRLERNLVGKGQSVFGIGINENANEIALGQSNPNGSLNAIKLEKTFNLEELLLNQSPGNLSAFKRATLNSDKGEIAKASSSTVMAAGRIVKLDEQRDGEVRSFSFTDKGQAIAVGSTYSLKKFSLSGSPMANFSGHQGEVWALADFASEGLLVSGSNDQTVKIWNSKTGENLATLFVASDNEWVIWTPQGYYEASAGGEKYIGWHINKGRNKLAEFQDVSAFSEFYHKPEVVRAMLEIKSFEAVAAQLELNNKPEEKIDPPVITWNTAPNTIVQGNKTTVSFSILSHSPVTHIKLLADGRPIYKESELSISGDGYAEKVNLDIELPEGTNQSYSFSVFAQDKNSKVISGERVIAFENPEVEENISEQTVVQETAYETDDREEIAQNYDQPKEIIEETNRDQSRVTLDPVDQKVKRGSLYLVTIGVSEFRDSSLNLRFADDDADAIDEIFKDQKGKLFNSVTSIKLTNENATREKILKTFQRLEQYTTVDDNVIIFIASHGMNVDENFYIIPHDGDARNPRYSCIDWRDFSDLVGNMSAKVVLFIDTCHSGQLGNNIGQKKLSNTEAVRQLSGKEYGVVIMAAATGYEYSLEHPDWGHGAFTLSLIEGIQQGKADIKPDGTVYLRELDYYLSERVQELTGGRQHPTTQKPSSISRLSVAEIK